MMQNWHAWQWILLIDLIIHFPPLSGGSGLLLAGLVRGLLEFCPLRPIVLLAQGFAKGREVAYSAVQGLLARAIPFWAAHEFGFVLGFLKK